MRPTWSVGYRGSGGEIPAVYALLSLMGIVFIADWALQGLLTIQLAWPVSGLWFRALPLHLWQPLTFPFVHYTNFFYLITDGIVLYFFGGSLERAWGSGKFLFFFFASGIVTALGVMVLSPWFPSAALFAGMMGSWLALVVAFAAMNPYLPVLLVIFPIQARWLAVLSAAWELFGRSGAYGGPVQSLAAVTFAAGFAYLFATRRWSLRWPSRGTGPSFKDRLERWQQKRRMREWQRRVSRVQRPEDLFKDKK